MGAGKNGSARYSCAHIFPSVATQAIFLVVCYTVLRNATKNSCVADDLSCGHRTKEARLIGYISFTNISEGTVFLLQGLTGSFRLFLVDGCSVHARLRISVS